MGKNDSAWETLFERYDILSHIAQTGFYEIDAATIRTVREPRLMSKFDHHTNLPDIFRRHGLCILPISRSRYIIGPFHAYQQMYDAVHAKPTRVHFPAHITSINPCNLYSESVALHCAYVCGMIDDLLGEPSLPTVSGRMSSSDFSFTIRTESGSNQCISVSKSQIEIDAGYESAHSFLVVEAKNESASDFLIRQLYYPYRLWQDKLNKRVIPVFFTYSNDIFSFFVYEFDEVSNYNSLHLVQRRDYVIAHEEITLDDVVYVLDSTPTVAEPTVAFPQADTFLRLIDLLGLLVNRDLEKDFITTNYSFDKRQTNYYTAAGMYLGLIERYVDEHHAVCFRLTPRGRKIMALPYKQKYLSIVTTILEHAVFQRVLREYMATGALPDVSRVVEHMQACGVYGIDAESTYRRRAQTVLKWIEWIIGLQNQ
ncbi:hypothetical protein AAC03nite_30250 [Alicyclobacillus acidoterrestris]|nr:hypothetical protein AAC03nite_30250 [Alicyclobacillus acidoterrestris]